MIALSLSRKVRIFSVNVIDNYLEKELSFITQ